MSMETDKIILRPWRESDAEALFKYASDPNVGPRAGWPPHKSVEESLEIIRTVFHNDHTWAIELKQTGESIGCIGYYLYGESNITIGEHDAEVGYWVAKPYWNQGICSESLRLMIDYCFQEQHFEVLWCDCFVDNPASERVMHKCDFRDTGAFNLCSHLYLGDDRLVKIMRLDGSAYIETKLFALQDKAYADFQSKLLPTVPREKVIGVRTPAKWRSKSARLLLRKSSCTVCHIAILTRTNCTRLFCRKKRISKCVLKDWSSSCHMWITGRRATNYRLVASRSILKNYYRLFASG